MQLHREELWDEPGDGLTHSSRVSNTDPRESFMKLLCWPCNGKWMESIEKRVAPLLLQLAAGTPVALSAEDQRLISLWAVVASFIRGKLSKAPSSVINADCESVRKTDEVPEGYKVWIVQGARRDDLPTRHHSYLTSAGVAYLGWIWLGSTVVVVASANGAEAAMFALWRIDPIVKMIHPSESPVLEWPVFAESLGAGITREALLEIAPGWNG